MTKAKANRAHKDRLFRLIFREKKDLLSLYNAVNRSHYQNPDELEVRTLKDVLYLSMKNDLAFLIKNELNLYEAQSTFNPNMPLRGLSYFSRLYQGYVESRKLDVYSSGKIILPAPRNRRRARPGRSGGPGGGCLPGEWNFKGAFVRAPSGGEACDFNRI